MKKYIISSLYIFILTIMSAAAQTPLPYPTDTIEGQIFYRYTPEKSIGLYRISKLFDVSQDLIIKYNPQLQLRGPRLDEVLLIPFKQDLLDTLTNNVSPITTDTIPKDIISEQPITVTDYYPDSVFIRSDTRPINIAMILPLNADAIERDGNDERFFDFYMGSLIAVKQAVESGISIQMHTYDIKKGSRKIEELKNDSFIRKADIIIGPAYSDQVSVIEPLAQKDSTWILIPFTSNVPNIDSNPFILQFNPDMETDAEAMARYIKDRENDINIIVIDAEKDNIPHSIRILKNKLQSFNIPLTPVTLKQILADSLFVSLRDSAENILIFNTEKYSNLQILMPHIIAANQNYLITLMSQYSWQKENIPIGQIYTSVFSTDTIATSGTTDYNTYWNRYFPFSFHSVLPRYDMLGYDLTNYIINLISQLRDIADDEYADYLLKRVYKGIQSNIRFEKVSENGGYINKGIQIQTR